MPKKGDSSPKHPIGDRTDPHGLAALCSAYLTALRVRNFSGVTVDRRLELLNQFLRWAAIGV